MSNMDLIRSKVFNGERLNEEDGLFLFESPDLISIGELADYVNHKKHDDYVFYNINRHINPTNICVMSCKFCAFSRKVGEEGGYAYTMEEILERAGKALAEGATELHIVGGLHPDWGIDHFETMFRTIKEHYPTLHIKGLTAVEIDWLAKRAKLSVHDALLRLNQAGLDSMPGGGAEVFHPDIRRKITAKLSTTRWIDIHRTAHKMGLRSNCTMLYGHVETYEHRVYHLKCLRDLQDETGGFNVFIPLSFQPHQNEMGINRYTFGFDDLKMMAVARLFLDNFKHIKSYWIMMGQDVCQLGTEYGANDMDGTVKEEKISRMAGGRGGMVMTLGDFKILAESTGRRLIERDTLYNPLGEKGEKRERTDSQTSKYLLSKAEKLTVLNRDELQVLVEESTTFALAQSATKIRSSHLGALASQVSVSFVNRLILDSRVCADPLGALAELEAKSNNELGCQPKGICLEIKSDASDFMKWEELLSVLQTLHTARASKYIVIEGVSGLNTLIAQAGLSLEVGFYELFSRGVSTLDANGKDPSREPLQELMSFHRVAHRNELPTVASVSIKTDPQTRQILWNELFDTFEMLNSIQRSTRGFLGCKIEVESGSVLTPYEYMRVISLARVGLPLFRHITAPFLSIPVVSQSKGEGSTFHRPEEKIAPIALAYGASDLGHIALDQLLGDVVAEGIRSSGFEPLVRDARWNVETLDLGPLQKNLKHVPLLNQF